MTVAGAEARRGGLRQGRLQSEPVTSAVLGSTPEAFSLASDGSRYAHGRYVRALVSLVAEVHRQGLLLEYSNVRAMVTFSGGSEAKK